MKWCKVQVWLTTFVVCFKLSVLSQSSLDKDLELSWLFMVEGKSLGSRPKLNFWENIMTCYLTLFSCSLLCSLFSSQISQWMYVTKYSVIFVVHQHVKVPSCRLFLAVYFMFYIILAKAQLRFYNYFVLIIRSIWNLYMWHRHS